MTEVKITVGFFKDYHGVIEGYVHNKAIIAVPDESGRDELILLKSNEYDVIEYWFYTGRW